MLEIVIATRNPGKLREIKQILEDEECQIKLLSFKDFSSFPEIMEKGKTMEENAIYKAKIITQFTGKWALGEDSGLEVEYLGGKPGVRSSRFAGEGVSDEAKIHKLLRLMERVPAAQRKARFRCVIALASPKGEVRTAVGICEGRVSEYSEGESGFGYDPVFIPDGYKKTFAQLGEKIKNRISHRASALRQLKGLLRDLKVNTGE